LSPPHPGRATEIRIFSAFETIHGDAERRPQAVRGRSAAHGFGLDKAAACATAEAGRETDGHRRRGHAGSVGVVARAHKSRPFTTD
jgi:hypothetical protein